MSSIVAAIQARMGSSRVPGKALLDLAGRPLVGHMVDRLRRVRHVSEIVLATTTDPRNAPLVAFAKSEGIGVVQHPAENDLAGRFAGLIENRRGQFVLRTSGDCPLIDVGVLQRMVDVALSDPDADFVSNRINWSYPLGLSVDVISRRSIEWCDRNLVGAEDREFFATYIRDHADRFKVIPIVNDVDLSHHGWTVDEPADVEFMRRIFGRLYMPGGYFGLNDILAYLETEKRRLGTASNA